MKQIGIVEDIVGNNINVRIKRASACGENCANCKGGCTPTEKIVKARNDAGAKIGDTVVLQMDNKNVLTAAFLVYILPLMVLFAVYGIVFALSANEGISALCGVLGMFMTFFAVRFIDKRMRDKYILIAVNVL